MARDYRKGSILIILLWMLMAMSILCISFAKSVRVEANAVVNNRTLATAYYLAQAGIEDTIYKMIVYRIDTHVRRDLLKPMDIDLGKVELKADVGKVVVKICDEAGKINVNKANKELLYSLLLSLGEDEEKADAISDSIIDWRDRDDDIHLNGAESDYYMSLNPPYRAKNAPLDTIEELLLVKDVDTALFYGHMYRDEEGRLRFMPGLNQCLTVYGSAIGINVNSAPYPVLIAMGFDPGTASAVIKEREMKPFKDRQDFNMRISSAPGRDVLKAPIITRPPLQYSYFSLISTAKINNTRIEKRILAVVRLNRSLPLKHTIVYWNENYFLQEQE